MRALLLVLAAAMLAACTEVTQTLSPSDVNVTSEQPTPTTTAPPSQASGTITLEPASVSVAVGKNVNVQVTVRDPNGVEVPSENLSVNIADKSVLRLSEIDGRILQFEGLAAGTTSVIVSTSGLQTSLVATVEP